MLRVETTQQSRVVQGDIIRNVEYFEHAYIEEGNIEVTKINFPLIIVLTQDCDLEQEFTSRQEQKPSQDKSLISILVAPLYNAEHVKEGSHLKSLKIAMENMGSKKFKYIESKQRVRYHYLSFPDDISIVPSVIDFKHYFSVNLNYLEDQKRDNFVCSVSALYREDISHRFAHFLSRVGLPDF